MTLFLCLLSKRIISFYTELAILAKHNAATSNRRFNALFATSSINDAIAYHTQFAQIQKEKQKADTSYLPLNIACVFSPPAESNKDILQIQEDLQQEKIDNKENPEHKKTALKEIITPPITLNTEHPTT